MNLLDENFPEDQLPFLRQWRIHYRQIGRDMGLAGIQDADVIPLLHQLRQVTFFTNDQDFFKRHLCHPGYCLAILDVRPDDAAAMLRRFLGHWRFKTVAKRMGHVVKVRYGAIHFWSSGNPPLQKAYWKGSHENE